MIGDVVGYYTPTGLANLQAQLDALRTQTVVFNGYLARLTETTALFTTFNGCATGLTGAQLWLELPIPTGVTVLSVIARVFDNVTPLYQIDLRRRTVSGISSVTAVLRSQNDPAQVALGMRTIDLTPVVPETLDPGESLAVLFQDGNSAVNGYGDGLCDVTVTYRLPGG